MQLFSTDPKIFSKKFQINFLSIKTLKKWATKVAHNRLRKIQVKVEFCERLKKATDRETVNCVQG